MFLSHLKLQNWRNFQKANVALQDRMFVVGPNASGKSNFLDVFRFLRDVAKPGGGLQRAILDRGGLSAIRCFAARKYPDVEIEVEFKTDKTQGFVWKYALGVKQQPRGDRKPFVTYERVWNGNGLILDRPNEDDRTDEMRLTQTHLEQINANAQFRDIARHLERTTYLHLIPQLVRHPREFLGPNLTGDPFGRSFLERLGQTPDGTRKARLRQIEKVLRIAVPQLKELAYVVDSEEGGVPHLEAVYEHWRPNAGRQRERDFSDGTLRLLGLLWSLLESDSLLLLEEPELSLHEAIVRQLAPSIFRAQRKKGRQVLISTHSFELLSDKGIEAEEVLILRPSKEGTEVHTASDVSDVKELLAGGVSVGDAVLPLTRPGNLSQLSLFE